ncbi:MAG: hypothetical protein DVB27_01990 [Verrucomicrobia bacterium]|jgi:hypothetical protein|nr:MAG: hypothetical protein DVB27_01990 [Verrucomicrobiota bacterium]
MNAVETTEHAPCALRTDGPEWRAAEAAGHDMSLIVETLRQSVWERFKMNDSALSLALMLRQAMTEQYGGPRANPDTAH